MLYMWLPIIQVQNSREIPPPDEQSLLIYLVHPDWGKKIIEKLSGVTFGAGHYALMWDLMWTCGAYPATIRPR